MVPVREQQRLEFAIREVSDGMRAVARSELEQSREIGSYRERVGLRARHEAVENLFLKRGQSGVERESSAAGAQLLASSPARAMRRSQADFMSGRAILR